MKGAEAWLGDGADYEVQNLVLPYPPGAWVALG